MKKVLVLSTINGLAGRNCLTGIFRYVNSGLDWSIRFIERPDAGGARVLDFLSSGEVDGVIVSLDQQTELLPHILRTQLPAVMIHDKTGIAPRGRRNFVLVRNDDLAVGRLAARHLLERGRFASFVYLPTENRTSWSIFRERGFRLELARQRIVPHRWHRVRESLAELLLGLPQPVAIMGATDIEAMIAIDVCRANRIPIPARAAIVSVDNDEMLCESTKPTLSSIRTDDGLIGELAARALDGLMRSRKAAAAREILVPPTEVVERNSTRAIPPAGHLIQDALRYIHANVTKGVTVSDVVRHLHVSPSLARTRFQEVTGKSIRDTILGTRLALAEKKLRTTTEPIARIAKSCGFASPCRMAHFFQERHGVSPSDFRLRKDPRPPGVRRRRKRR
ncbi:MAG: substrate-binding domain-containing protein [Kiritimatiellia bacterium]